MKKLILLIILQILFWGCTSTPLSIKTELNKFPVQGDSKRISAEACGFQFLLLIPIGINDRQVRAYTLLQMQAVGGTLDEIKMEESWIYGLIGTSYCTKFSADLYGRQ